GIGTDAITTASKTGSTSGTAVSTKISRGHKATVSPGFADYSRAGQGSGAPNWTVYESPSPAELFALSSIHSRLRHTLISRSPTPPVGRLRSSPRADASASMFLLRGEGCS